MTDKHQQRRALLRARRTLSASEHQSFSEVIDAKILASDAYKKAKTCLLYASMRDEVQTDKLIADALKAGKCVCLPYITSRQDSLMQAAQIQSLEDLERGAYDILTVKQDRLRFIEPQKLDFILVPAVGIDRCGWRMGMGGGYYDRYLPQASNAERVCAVYSCQLADEIAKDKHDVRMDIVITEKDSIYIE